MLILVFCFQVIIEVSSFVVIIDVNIVPACTLWPKYLFWEKALNAGLENTERGGVCPHVWPPSGANARPHNPLKGREFALGDVSLKWGTVPAVGTPRFISNTNQNNNNKNSDYSVILDAPILFYY